jgi:predicted O-methyltransferase YrrM
MCLTEPQASACAIARAKARGSGIISGMDRRVAECIQRLERFMTTVDDAMAVPREAGAFMHALILAMRARRAVEIGTSYGYSGLWIGSALAENGGKMVTIDRDPRKIASARSTFENAGLGRVIELRTGEALEVLPALDGPFDFMLNDADKQNCRRYLEIAAGNLSERGIILTDNTITHADQLVGFVQWVRGLEGFFSTRIPVGNGMEMTVRI